MEIKLILLTICLCSFFKHGASKPQYGRDYNPEARTHKKKHQNQNPCANFPQHHKGRTFLDWNLQHIDISYNYNYLVNCGGNAGGGSGQKPSLLGSHLQGLGLLGNGGLLGSHLQGGQLGTQDVPNPVPIGNYPQINNRPPVYKPPLPPPNRPILSGLLSQVQTQTQNFASNGGIFNGQGIGSILPTLPPNGLFNGNGQNFFSNLFGNFFNGGSSSSSSSSSSGGSGNNPGVNIPTATVDPNDIIYNDDKPVHEEPDDVPENYNHLRPGSYYNRYPNTNNGYHNGYYNDKFVGYQNQYSRY